MTTRTEITAKLAQIKEQAKANIHEVPHFGRTRMEQGWYSEMVGTYKVTAVAEPGSQVVVYWSVNGSRVGYAKLVKMLEAA